VLGLYNRRHDRRNDSALADEKGLNFLARMLSKAIQTTN